MSDINIKFYQLQMMQKNDKPKCIKNNNCYSVCCNQKCLKVPFMCKQEDCQCNIHHQQCITNIRWNLLKEKVLNKIKQQQENLKSTIDEIDIIFAGIQKEISKFYDQVQQTILNMKIGKKLIEFEKNLKDNSYGQLNGSHIYSLSKEMKQSYNMILMPSIINNEHLINNILEHVTKIPQVLKQYSHKKVQGRMNNFSNIFTQKFQSTPINNQLFPFSNSLVNKSKEILDVSNNNNLNSLFKQNRMVSTKLPSVKQKFQKPKQKHPIEKSSQQQE